jgi:hypothetical protein
MTLFTAMPILLSARSRLLAASMRSVFALGLGRVKTPGRSIDAHGIGDAATTMPSLLPSAA